MPQNTNLNVAPYFDDFNEDKAYHKVLFKPGAPVQARELTTLQSILQNQIEKFGQHFFKEGSVVIPGQIAFDSEYYAVEIDPTFLGIPVSAYIDKLVGSSIRGETSGVTATVVNYITNTQSERNNYTLYLKYQKSSTVDFNTAVFSDGENLITDNEIEYGISRITAGNPFATCIANNATSKASAAAIENGVYFIRGYFVSVLSQTVILDQYSNTPTYRVGLSVDEQLVNAFDDETLFDNAQGYSNFSAPGADRFKISTTLIKKDIDDFNDQDFIELLRVENGVVQKFVKKTDYNLFADELARRTYDESGNYYIRPFSLNLRESLDNRIGNDGIYLPTQKTAKGNTPSESLMTLQISPGKAYVKGYEIEKVGNTTVDIEKPRSTKTVSAASVPFDTANFIRLNRVHGSPVVGFGTTATVSLRSERIGATDGDKTGIEIGLARVYDYKLKDTAYVDDTTQYELYLYDIQTFSTLTLSSSITQTAPALIEGARSGARGFLRSDASDSLSLTLYQTNGIFTIGEPIIVNGIEQQQEVTSVREYGLRDTKSVHQTVGINTFNADTVLSQRFLVAPQGTNFTVGTAGIVTAPGQRFAAGINTGDIITYNIAGFSTATFNRVSALSSDGSTITLAALTDVNGVCDGSLPATEIQTSDFTLVNPIIFNSKNADFFAELPNQVVESVDLSNSEIVIRKQFALNVANNSGTVTLSNQDEFFLPFDEERYNLVYSTGAVESLTSSNITFNSTFKTATLSQLDLASDTNALLVCTVKKINLTNKNKVLNKCSSLTINRSSNSASGSSTTSLNDGLTNSAVYGTRVQDKEISLNVPDVVQVRAIFESKTNSDPVLPSITLTNRSGDLTDFIQGEQVIGSLSGAVARVISATATVLTIVYENDLRFQTQEVVSLQSSGITGEVLSLIVGDKNILNDFSFDDGQRQQYYDYSRIVRKSQSNVPSKRLTVVFDNFTIDSGDEGDLITASSYSEEDYLFGAIKEFNGRSISDSIDIRPRVTAYNPSSDTLSPFEFSARSFAGTGQYSPDIMVSGETTTLSYNYYLPRIDKILLSPTGFFEHKKGNPSEAPQPPTIEDGSLDVATLYLPAFMADAKSGVVSLSKHRRYTMSDISRLEKRISNIEYYTQLSLLESDTANTEVRDPLTGLNRFKSGFFVDNFRNHAFHALRHPDYRASIDRRRGELRPVHYTTGIDLLLGSSQVIGIGTTANPAADLTTVTDLQTDKLKRTGDVVTLDYTSEPFITQQFATRTENVNPFAVINWLGVIEMNPASDTWLDTNRIEPRNIEIEGDYEAYLSAFNVDPNTGLSEIDWGAWQETWSGTTTLNSLEIDRTRTGSQTISRWTQRGRGIRQVGTVRDTFSVTNLETVQVDRALSRTGIQLNVAERVDTRSLGDRLVSQENIQYMRSRNIEFIARRIKPRTRFYSFLDNKDVSNFSVPKLLEVTMSQGTFQVGETVTGTMPGTGVGEFDNSPTITFRVAQQNHKYGPYNNPNIVYTVNPYSDNVGLSTTYSSTSTILNVDTGSLELQSQSDFYGYVRNGMKLVGNTSGAEATISNLRMITDDKGTLIGSLFIPDGNKSPNPIFETGEKVFRLTSSAVNAIDPRVDPLSAAEQIWRSQGTLDTFQEDILSTRNAEVQRSTVTDDTRVSQTSLRTVETEDTSDRFVAFTGWYDPLAESFEITEDSGVFVTECDIYFQTKDPNIPVTLQIRTMIAGLPSTNIIPFGEAIYEPSQINTSEDGTVATRFVFPSPVYLRGNNEYALVLVSASNNYRVFISRMGEEDISTINLPESEKIIVAQQPYMGSLFKSQNGSTWDASQFEDLKFKLYKAQFKQGPGVLKFYNPNLGQGNNQNPILRPNAFEAIPQTITVGFGSTARTRDFGVGSLMTQVNNQLTSGSVTKVAGSIKINTSATEAGGITTNTVGTGLTPSSGNFTYTGIALTTITGSGSGAVANIQVSNGSIGVVTVTSGGTGYVVGDVLGASVGSVGSGTKFNVGIVSATNYIEMTNVQGTFTTSTELMTINAVGVASTLPGSQPTSVGNKSAVQDGRHVKVNHRNHGMHSRSNRVTISGAIGYGQTVTQLASEYENTSTASIQVDSAAFFSSFENVSVASTNPGYVKIGNEVIQYTGTDTGSTPNLLTGITRSIDNTIAETHAIDSIVQKYESFGVSLRRINTTHVLTDPDSTADITLDSYYIKLDTTSSGVGTVRDGSNDFPRLQVSEKGSFGGLTARATQNIQFEALTPNISYMTLKNTSLQGRVRTVSGTSVDGSETSFIDQGFETIALNEVNYFTTPRIICSRVNETNSLTSLPGSKSFTTELVFDTQDVNVSPVVDLDRVSIIATTNRIDNPVSNYQVDSRSNQNVGDPHAGCYITRRVNLENPATSLRVEFAANRPPSTNFRVLYKLFRSDSSFDQPFELFPGYDNLQDTDGDGFGDKVINAANNSGLPDKFIPANPLDGQFSDYRYTAENLPEFNGFVLKIVMTGTNQAYVPHLKDVRVIALA